MLVKSKLLSFLTQCKANPHMIRMLEKEKNVLMNQMRDMEWRLDQESKVTNQNQMFKPQMLKALHIHIIGK